MKRAHPPKLENLHVTLEGVTMPVFTGVPEEACLPMPEKYRLPKHGRLHQSVMYALLAFSRGRATYVHGMPGVGKDALWHYLSALTHRPAIIKQVVPGADIGEWFFSHAFDERGTFVREGEVLKALRDGYRCEDGTVVPYMLVLSDIDRMDPSQAEAFRLILDSIQGRINGPDGRVYKVLPGTLIVATANSMGGGDPRGRMVSARPMDASILDRFLYKLEFPNMDVEDEMEILREKFPGLYKEAPQIFRELRRVIEVLRHEISKGELYAEFSHRAVCAVLTAIDDWRSFTGGKVAHDMLGRCFKVWLDGLVDPETRQAAQKLIDPCVTGGTL